MEEFCEHLKQIGVRAKVVDCNSPEAIHHSPTLGIFGNQPIGCIKIEGRNIDAAEVYRVVSSAGGGPKTPRHSRVLYFYSYVVRGRVEGLENELKAEVKPVEKGLFKKELVDFTWKGGRLAQLLNGDSELRTMLIKISVPNIEISPNKKDEYVDISFRPRKWTENTVKISGIPVKYEQTIGRKAFPSREAFEAYDRIAQHVRSVIGA